MRDVETLFQQKEYEKAAQRAVENAVSYQGKDRIWFLKRASDSYEKLEKWARAAACLEEAVAVLGEDREVAVLLMRAATLRGKQSEQDQQALKDLKDVVARFPKSAEASAALFLLGELKLNWGFPKDAVVAWEELVAGYPESRESSLAWRRMAEARLQQGNVPGALSDLARGAQLKGSIWKEETLECHLRSGEILADAGRMDDAIKVFQELAAENIKWTQAQDAHLQLAKVKERTGRPEEAEEWLTRLISREDSCDWRVIIEARKDLWQMHLRRRNIEPGLEMWKGALDKAESANDSEMIRAFLLQYMKALLAAWKEIKSQRQLTAAEHSAFRLWQQYQSTDEGGEGLIALADVYWEQGRRKESFQILERQLVEAVTASEELKIKVYQKLAELAIRNERDEDAASYWEHLAAEFPESKAACKALADAGMKRVALGEIMQGVRQLQCAAAYDPAKAGLEPLNAKYSLAEVFLLAGKQKEGERLLQQIAAGPEGAEPVMNAIARLGQIELGRDNPANARFYFEKVLERENKNRWKQCYVARMGLGEIARRNNDVATAVEIWEKGMVFARSTGDSEAILSFTTGKTEMLQWASSINEEAAKKAKELYDRLPDEFAASAEGRNSASKLITMLWAYGLRQQAINLALAVWDRMDNSEIRLRIEIGNQLAKMLGDMGHKDESIKAFAGLLQIASSQRLQEEYVDVLVKLGGTLLDSNRVDEAVLLLSDLPQFITAVNFKNRVDVLLGSALSAKGATTEAFAAWARVHENPDADAGLKEEALKRAAELAYTNNDFANAAGFSSRIVDELPQSESAKELLEEKKEFIGKCYEQAYNFVRAREWYNKVGLVHAAREASKRLERLELVKLEVKDCYVGSEGICRSLIMNSHTKQENIWVGIKVQPPDGPPNVGRIGPMLAPAHDVADISIAGRMDQPGLYRVTVNFGPDSLEGIFRVAQQKPAQIVAEPGQVVALPKDAIELVSAAARETERGWVADRPEKVVTGGSFVQMSVLLDSDMAFRFFYDPPHLQGILKVVYCEATNCPESGPTEDHSYHGDYIALRKGHSSLRFMLPENEILGRIYMECWHRQGSKAGLAYSGAPLEIKPDDLSGQPGLEKLELHGAQVLRQKEGERLVNLVISSDESRQCYIEVTGTCAPSPAYMAPRYCIFTDGWPATVGSEACLWLNEEAENAAFRRMLWLQPINLKPGSNLLKLRLPAGEAISSVKLLPALKGLVAGLEFPAGKRDFNPAMPAEATLSARFVGDKPSSEEGEIRIAYQQVRLADSEAEGSQSISSRMFQTLLLGVHRMQFKAGENLSAKLALPTSLYGVNQIAAVIRFGDSISAQPLGRYAVVPQRNISVFREDTPFLIQSDMSVEPETYRRLGFDWLLTRVTWDGFQPEERRYDWRVPDAIAQQCRRAKLMLCNICSGAPKWAQPAGRFRPLLNYDNLVFLDSAPSPAHMDSWIRGWQSYMQRYADIIGAVQLWGEPWEGGTTPDWRSTGAHYRRLLKGLAVARAGMARQPKVLAGGRAHNADWNVLDNESVPFLDAINTIGAHPDESFAFSLARLFNKEVWETWTDTTTWGDRSAAAWAIMHMAKGTRKMNLFGGGKIWDVEGNPRPVVAWAAFMTHILDGFTFSRFTRPDRPPLICLFSKQDRKVAVIISGNGCVPDNYAEFPWRNFQNLTNLEMELDDPSGRTDAFDAIGNPIGRREGGKLFLAIGRDLVYVRTEGTAGADFEERLDKAAFRNIPPVEIALRDPCFPIEKGPAIRVIIRNTGWENATGSVMLESPSVKFAAMPLSFQQLAPGKTVELEAVITPASLESSAFPVRVTAQVGGANVVHDEVLSVATITRATITVDGFLDEWRTVNAVPVILAGKSDSSLKFAPKWTPWKQLTAGAVGRAARVAFAWDDENLYAMSEVFDPNPVRIPSLLSGVERHVWQEPPADYIYYQAGPWPGFTGDAMLLSMDSPYRTEWVQRYEEAPPQSETYAWGSILAGRYQYQLYPTLEGTTEVFRFRTPDFYYRHPLPLDYTFMAEKCSVKKASVVCSRNDDLKSWFYEAKIPWSELRHIPHNPGLLMRLNFKINDDTAATSLTWSKDRSVAAPTLLDFEPTWMLDWSSNTEWGFDSPGK
ncbi:MAG TPA: tetratricopeptide repeat protein [Candidatus Brocadiia bacterium]|nr:tetratricopeptide repeat protein [Candidatus Brocadiia bacterium]